MKDYLLVICCCLTSVGVHATPLGHMRSAEIATIDGQPAICLPIDTKKPFSVGWVTLSESYARSPKAWGLALKEGRDPVILQPGDCFSYGVVPDAYEVEENEAYDQPLVVEVNKAYVFEISSASLSADVYSVSFLVYAGEEGARYIEYSASSIIKRKIPSCDSGSTGDSQ